MNTMAEVELSIDRLEAIRLSDVEGLEQEEAAKRMKISRQTFGRILANARRAIADAVVNGKALRIEEGNIVMAPKRKFCCTSCEHSWALAKGKGNPATCPFCRSKNIHHSEKDRKL